VPVAEPALAGLAAESASSTGTAVVARDDGLTVREVEVLRLLAGGLTNREIARRLVLSPRTVENHVFRIYARIGARGRADATAYAIHHGVI
jgi:DNA-binding NarL/FixJ family response regulator